MRVLVTGGSGFIGRFLVAELALRGYDTIDIFDVKPPDFDTGANFIKGDIVDDVSKLQPYDIVFHAAASLGAATTFDTTKETARTNILGTLAVLALQPAGSVVVQPGILGDWLNPYFISKDAATRYGLMYREYFGLRYVCPRFPVIYGPGQNLSQKKVVPTFVMQALLGEPITIYGDGSYILRFFYVGDAAKILVSVAPRVDELPGEFDVVSQVNCISVKNLAEKIIHMTNSTSKLTFLPMRRGQSKDAKDTGADLEMARRIYDILDVTEAPLDRALQETIDWYDEQL